MTPRRRAALAVLLAAATSRAGAQAASGAPAEAAAGQATPAPDAKEEDPLRIVDLAPEAVIANHLYEGRLSGPAGVWCDGDRGEVVVADMQNSLIGIFDMKLVPLFAFSDPGRLSEPHSVAVDPRGRMLVLDAERDRVKLYSYRGEFIRYLALEGFEKKSDAHFTALALDANGDLYLANGTSGEILVFDSSGRRKRSFGNKGNGPGLFTTVAGLAVDATTVYVSDMVSLGVQLFDKYGRYLRGWGRHEAGIANVSLPAGIAVDRKGRIFLVDTMRHEIKAYRPDGTLIGRYAGSGQEAGEVLFPVGLSTNRDGLLCVGDRGNERVQLMSVRETPPPPPEPRAPRGRARAAAPMEP